MIIKAGKGCAFSPSQSYKGDPVIHRFTLIGFVLCIVAFPAASKELIVPISAVAQGANNTLFRTDARIFNPSGDKTINVTAEFLPANRDNTGGATRNITILPGQMLVLNNIVGDFFAASGLGAIRFESDDEFRVTSRTFTDSPNAAAPGTFGQFIPAAEQSDAMASGVLLHLSNDTNLSQGFRANTGFMNPGSAPVSVAVIVRLANGTQIGTGNVGPIPPRSVTQVSVGASIGNNVSFADGFMTFSAPAPVIGFASVVDNRSSDQIFVAAQEHPAPVVIQPPAAKEVVVNVGPGTSFNPVNVTINKGDTITWNFLAPLPHTSRSDLRTGSEVWDSGTKTSGTFSRRFQTEGAHPYHCQIHSFAGGTFMNGVITVTNITAAGSARLAARGKDMSSTGPVPSEADRHAHHTARGASRK